MSPILGIWASQNYSRYSLPTSFESIATTTVGSGGVSSVTFSSIPSTYKHLQIRYISRDGTNASASSNLLRMNGSSTSSDYIYLHYLGGDGSSTFTGNGLTNTSIYGGRISAANAPSSVFGIGIIDILDYADTNKFKTIKVMSGFDENGGGDLYLTSGAYIKTTAISSITVLPSSGNLQQYSHFALYGIKGE